MNGELSATTASLLFVFIFIVPHHAKLQTLSSTKTVCFKFTYFWLPLYLSSAWFWSGAVLKKKKVHKKLNFILYLIFTSLQKDLTQKESIHTIGYCFILNNSFVKVCWCPRSLHMISIIWSFAWCGEIRRNYK